MASDNMRLGESMSENKTPFEKAEHNIELLAKRLDMMKTLFDLKSLLDTTKDLSEHESEGVHKIIDMALINLSEFLSSSGEKWN